ncbi:MAG: chorismate synthase [Hydrogenophilus sp.]|nr:chorismate synthase [Hydrogenophilus sp.]
MSGNTFGHLFRVTTFGESHGPAIGCVVDGCPPGIPLGVEQIQRELDRRRPGGSRFVTQRQEADRVELLSGVFEGVTTGTPIALLIRNEDVRPQDYAALADRFRPGHADYPYLMKYGVRDYRGGGRASARETAARVAAGAIAKVWLKQRYGVTIRGFLAQLGPFVPPFSSWEEVEENPFFVPNLAVVPELEEYLDGLRKIGDSVGGRVTVVATGVPVGWGSPVFSKLDAEIAYAMMGINAVKGVEIGDGCAVAEQHGSQHGDEMSRTGFLSNHAGGVLGGISSGQPIVVHLAVKPTSSIRFPKRSVTVNGEEVAVTTQGRHDPCIAIRAVPIAEAMLALVLADAALRHRAQCGDVHPPLSPIPAVSPEADLPFPLPPVE